MATAQNSRIAILLAVTLAAGALFAQTISTGKTVRRSRIGDDSITRAEAAIEKKEYTAAEPLLDQAVKTNPQDFRAWYDLAFIYNATGRTSDAIEAYKKSVAAKPDVFETNLNLGLMLAQAGDAGAEKYLRAATTLKPASRPNENLAQAWTALARVLRKSNPKASLEAYAKVAQLRPTDPEPHLAAAEVADQAKNYSAAEAEYQKAAQLDPKSAEAVAGLANIYMETKRLDEAEQALKKYIAIAESNTQPGDANKPQTAPAHFQLGRILAELHRRPEAIAELEQGLQQSPDDVKAQRQLAWLYLQDKQYAKAEAAFRVVTAKAPNDADAHHGLGSSLLEQKKFPEAQEELLKAVQLKGDLADAYADLAFAASENKQYPLTLKALDYRAKFLPELPGTLFLRATAYDHLGDREHATASYKDFLAASNGRYPDQEWQARHRLIAIDPKKK